MVSPDFVRKAKQNKVKRIVSKGLKAIKNGHDHKIGKHTIRSRPDKTTNMGFQGGMSESRPTQSIPIESNIEMHAYQRNAYSSPRRASGFKETTRAHLQQNVPNNALLAQKHPHAPEIPQDMQETMNCYDSLFSVMAAKTNNAHGSSKSTRQRNKPLETNVRTPSVSDVDIIGYSTSLKPSSELQGTNTQASSIPDVGIIESSKPKRKRGKTKGHRLAKILDGGQRFEVMFPEHVNRPVGRYSTMFTTEIGVLVRQIAPLQANSWGGVSRERKDHIMARLQDKFIFSSKTHVIESIEKTMAKRYNSWRSRIHKQFSKYPTIAAAVSNSPPLGITIQDWIYLCNLFSTEKFKAISDRKRKNRDKLRTTHTAGTKAYSKIRYDKRNQTIQSDLDFVDLYEDTHIRSNGLWVHENAKMFHASLKEQKSKAVMEGTKLTDEQLSVLTFGQIQATFAA